MKKVILFVITCLLTGSLFGQHAKLSVAARSIIDPTIIYDPSYVRIKYPMGDVDPKRGVCTDVVIRAYREIGDDLQKLVHEDMKANFSKYPQRWGRTEPDSNIDHRRVPNLMKYFERNGTSLPITNNKKDYHAGAIVCWDLGSGILHIGIVTMDKKIVHNIGGGQVEEDCLFNWRIIGHYGYPIKEVTKKGEN